MLLKEMDTSHDGKVSPREFVTMVGNFMEGLRSEQKDQGMRAMRAAAEGLAEEVGRVDALQIPGENLRNELKTVQAELAAAKTAAAADARRIVEHEKTEAEMKEELERLNVEQAERNVCNGMAHMHTQDARMHQYTARSASMHPHMHGNHTLCAHIHTGACLCRHACRPTWPSLRLR